MKPLEFDELAAIEEVVDVLMALKDNGKKKERSDQTASKKSDDCDQRGQLQVS